MKTVIAFFVCLMASSVASASASASASVWNCSGAGTSRMIIPYKTKQEIQMSYQLDLHEDGTMVSDNHINNPVTGTYLLAPSLRKAYIYPDIESVTDAVYAANPEFSDFQVISAKSTMRFNKPLPYATEATYRTYVMEQFVNGNGVFVRVVGRGKFKCLRVE